MGKTTRFFYFKFGDGKIWYCWETGQSESGVPILLRRHCNAPVWPLEGSLRGIKSEQAPV